MSNFDIFNQDKLEALIKPFSSGMAPFITPIKYEALTPDIFALLFRTTSSDHTEHYFVSLEFDYVESIDIAINMIEKWHGTTIQEVWTPEGSADGADPKVKTSEVYYAILVKVDRPLGRGYWATNIVVSNESDIESAIAHLSSKQQDNVRTGLKSIFRDHPNVAISFYISDNGSVDFIFQ